VRSLRARLFALAVTLGLASLASCRPSASIVASTETSHFATPPVVVRRGGALALSFTQGSYPFYFLVECAPLSGRLVCAVRGSSSSGNLTGAPVDRPLDAPGAAEALAHGGATFWEPDGRMTPLRVVDVVDGARPPG
jgi:hypothetical protein